MDAEADETFWDIPVVVVTGLTRDDKDKEMETLIRCFLETAKAPRPEAYVEKPINEPQLLQAIREALSSHACATC